MYFIETGINLLEKVFDHLTEQQIKELKIKTDIQRTDSFQAASNIRRYSRLQLLVEMLLRIYRVLNEADKKQYEELFFPYLKKTSGQFIYRLEKDNIPSELEKVGIVYKEINDNLKAKYNDVDIFKKFDGSYGSADNDIKFDEYVITPIQTAIRGRVNSGVEITISKKEDQYSVSCPNQQVEAESGKKRFKGEFDLRICSLCIFASACRLQKMKTARVYYFTEEEYLKKKRIKDTERKKKFTGKRRSNCFRVHKKDE